MKYVIKPRGQKVLTYYDRNLIEILSENGFFKLSMKLEPKLWCLIVV